MQDYVKIVTIVLQESFSTIADEATTMRDPLFFRWHAWIDDFFQRHKESDAVRRYTRSEVILCSQGSLWIFLMAG